MKRIILTSLVSGFLLSLIPWHCRDEFYGQGLPIPLVIWDHGRDHLLLAPAINALVVLIGLSVGWGLVRCCKALRRGRSWLRVDSRPTLLVPGVTCCILQATATRLG
jgi:hypothetical protein